MEKYMVKFQKGNKIHKVIVKAVAIVPAIEDAVRKHFSKYTDALSYEIISAEKIAE